MLTLKITVKSMYSFMKKEPLINNKNDQSSARIINSRILFGFFVLIISFVFFIWFVLDEDIERILAVTGGVIFILALLGFQRLIINLIYKEQHRAQLSELKYKSFIENIPAVTYINDLSPEARTTYVSPQIEKFLGYTQKELIDDSLLWTQIIHPDDYERVMAENRKTSETLEDFKIEYRLIAKSGNIVWVKDEATVVYDENGQPAYWLGVWSDIAAIKEAESLQLNAFDSLTRRTNQLQTASEVSHAATSILSLDELLPEVVELIRSHFDYYYVGLFLVDRDFTILNLRAATGEVGKQLLQAQHSLPIGNTSMVGWSAANNKARIALDVGKEAIRFKNKLLPLTRSEIALPLRSRSRVIGAMTFQSEKESAFTDSDITALQTMCDQIANAIATASLFEDRANLIKELESKNAELEQFVYAVSHDLKSPLVTMRGYLGYLKNSAVQGDFARFDHDLERVIKATNTMQDLLNDLLNLSRVGRIEESVENVSVKDAVEKVLELVHNIYIDKKIEIFVQENLPTVKMNPVRLGEVMQNLIVNAMKFSAHQSTPKVVIGADGFDSATKFPILFVKDNGIGIKPQYHKKIFGLFNRLNSDIEGTGVGLTLVKRIVELYGGKIWVDSDGQGNGSIFYFTLPPA
jgi:PAS domain S-box-containing protein